MGSLDSKQSQYLVQVNLTAIFLIGGQQKELRQIEPGLINHKMNFKVYVMLFHLSGISILEIHFSE